MSNPFSTVVKFENALAEFFGAPYGVATDSCTHALELCLRYSQPMTKVTCPRRSYISVPFTLMKLALDWDFVDSDWRESYTLGGTNIIDGAVQWRKNSYLPDTRLCLSFQYRKHLPLGRGGIILLDDPNEAETLRKMRYDGRDLSRPWADQNITTVGYHYYMTPETAATGLEFLPNAISREPAQWDYRNYPDLLTNEVFYAKHK